MRRSAPSRPSTSCTCTSCPTSTRSSTRGRPGPGRASAAPDGRQAGEFTLSEALYDSLPVQPLPADRRRGPRPGDPGDAQGDGVRRRVDLHHARRRRRGRDRQARHLRDGGRRRTSPTTTPPGPSPTSIDIIVQLHLETTPLADGTAHRDRWVSEIITVAPGEREKGYAITHVFARRRRGARRRSRRAAGRVPASWSGTGSTWPASTPQPTRGRRHDPAVPAVAGALVVAGLHRRRRRTAAAARTAAATTTPSGDASRRPTVSRRTRLLLLAGLVARRGRSRC